MKDFSTHTYMQKFYWTPQGTKSKRYYWTTDKENGVIRKQFSEDEIKLVKSLIDCDGLDILLIGFKAEFTYYIGYEWPCKSFREFNVIAEMDDNYKTTYDIKEL